MVADMLGLDHPTDEAADYLRVVFRQNMADRNGQEWRYQTIHPRVFVSVQEFKRLWLDAVIAIGFLVASSGSAQSFTVLVGRALQTFKLLSEDESELVHVILHLSQGHAYVTPLSEDVLRKSYTNATISIDELLERIVKRGIATRNNGSIKLVF